MNSQNMNGINKLADYILEHPEDVVDFSLSLTDYNLDSNYVTYEITVRFPKNEKRLHENKKKSLKDLWSKKSDIIHNKIEIMSEMSDDPSGAKKVAEKAVYEAKKFFFDYLDIKED